MVRKYAKLNENLPKDHDDTGQKGNHDQLMDRQMDRKGVFNRDSTDNQTKAQ